MVIFRLFSPLYNVPATSLIYRQQKVFKIIVFRFLWTFLFSIVLLSKRVDIKKDLK